MQVYYLPNDKKNNQKGNKINACPGQNCENFESTSNRHCTFLLILIKLGGKHHEQSDGLCVFV